MRRYSLTQWDLLIEMAYGSGLIGKVGAILEKAGLVEYIPEQARWHFTSANRYQRAILHDIDTELSHLKRALKPLGITPVLLKGAAYIERADAAGDGRTFSDIDIFIDKTQLGAAEQFLKLQGWVFEPLDDYDEAFYRNWMHELPPMFHYKRGVPVDTHHSLLPLTSRINLNPDLLAIDTSESGRNGVHTLKVEDRFLHSAAHLLLEGEFDNGFRDLTDLFLLLTENFQTQADYQKLVERAETLGLTRVLFYALRYCDMFFATGTPQLRELDRGGATDIQLKVMDALFIRALAPRHPSTMDGYTAIANGLLYIRSHWLKMPMKLLVPHLFHKAFITPITERQRDKERVAEAESA